VKWEEAPDLLIFFKKGQKQKGDRSGLMADRMLFFSENPG
jgi:hypothetical protein